MIAIFMQYLAGEIKRVIIILLLSIYVQLNHMLTA